MAHVAAVEADASLVAPMKPLLARFRSLFGAALQIRQPPFVSPFTLQSKRPVNSRPRGTVAGHRSSRQSGTSEDGLAGVFTLKEAPEIEGRFFYRSELDRQVPDGDARGRAPDVPKL
jgi:hypothetical protein